MENQIAILPEFEGTTIKTPFEKLRARAIINAGLDAQGLSLIHFNLPAFLSTEKRNDAILILCLWASEPIRKQPKQFRNFPDQGQAALDKRTDILRDHLEKRKDLPHGFLDTAHTRMKEAIAKEMAYLLQSVA